MPRNVVYQWIFVILSLVFLLWLVMRFADRFMFISEWIFTEDTQDHFFPYEKKWSSVEYPTVTLPLGSIIKIEIADAQEEYRRGLSGHEPLTQNQGMLFLFDTKFQQRFWMKDMLFPIDIIWINDETIIGFIEDAQPENPVSTIYVSPEPVDRVLEVQAGFVRKYNLKAGDQLDIELSAQ